MKGLKKQRRIQIIVLAVVAMVASFAAFYIAAPNALQYFRSPTEVTENPPGPAETFRIGGLVEEGSLVRGQGAEITFRVTDGNGIVPVSYTGLLPDPPRTAAGFRSRRCRPTSSARSSPRKT